MKLQKNTSRTLERKFRKVMRTPASFAFFLAIHDFVEHIESNAVLSVALSHRTDINRDLKLPTKYGHLKQIYQGIEDTNGKSSRDLGHDRYMTICDLRRIKNNEESDNNAYWKKRETFRRLAAEVYERLSINLARV